MFAGPKSSLKPLYEKILALTVDVAPDIKICPCKTIVPLYRNHVFAQIKPKNKTQIDLGFALKNRGFTKRLFDTGGKMKKDRITHAVAITQLSDIDEEVVEWLKAAYQLDI